MLRRLVTARNFILLLLTVAAIRLLLATVQDPSDGPGRFMYERFRGWPWVYSHRINSIIPDTSEWHGWQPAGFSYVALFADIVVLLLTLILAALILARRVRRHGHLLKFSIAEALALVTLIAVACGWASTKHRDWQREQQALVSFPHESLRPENRYCGPEWLRRLWPARLTTFERAVELTADDNIPAAEIARCLSVAMPSFPYARELILHAKLAKALIDVHSFAQIHEVYLFSDESADDVNDALAVISRWPRLQKLTISIGNDESLSDRGIAALGESATFEDLTIAEGNLPHVTDAGIAALARAPRLKSITLPQLEISDAALKSLAEMRSLEYLQIAGAPRLTDAGVRYLSQSKSLRGIWLQGENDFSDDSRKLLKHMRANGD